MVNNRIEIEMSRMSDRSKEWQTYLPGWNVIIMCVLGGVVVSTLLISSRSLFTTRLHLLPDRMIANTIASNGADQWDDDETVTPPASTFSLQINKKINVSSLFNQYYQRYGAAENLGEPMTEAFPVNQGYIQFFKSGALLLPAALQGGTQNTNEALTALVNGGIKDPTTGIISLPLLQALLTVGSKASIGGAGSPVTYVDLRKATDPALMQPAPTKQFHIASSVNSLQTHFVQAGTRAGKDVGYFIPQVVWNYINRIDISPDGWRKDFGDPLTEALSFTLAVDGRPHHMLVQAFVHDGVLLDQDASDASGHSSIQRLATGVDYLRTFGLPPVAIHAQQTIWVQGEAGLLVNPASAQTIAHVGQNFVLNLLGDTSWTGGMLWYHVRWSTPGSTNTGWISAANITFVSPENTLQLASLDILSPQLANYLTNIGSNVGVVVYDVTRQRYYTYNSDTPFIVASSMKVPIMLTFFDALEQQGQEPDADQMNVLSTMIENSDNDSASELYFNELNGATSITNYMEKIRVTGLNPNADAWGYSTITPQTMVDLLTLLYEGKVLTAQDRATAYNLLENIESDQQVGVGDTAPNGFTVAMKDGWVTGPDNLWAMNSSGIVMSKKETYIISVYTQEQQSLDDGQAIVRHVCSSVASLLP